MAGFTKLLVAASVAAGVLTVVGTAAPIVPARPAAADVSSSAVFVSIEPCRLVDTRLQGSPVGGIPRTFRVAGTSGAPGEYAAQGGHDGGCGVPDDATAIKASISAVDPAGAGFLRAWPAGTTPPNATFLNYSTDSTTNSGALAIATDPTSADLTVKAFNGTTDLVIDVQGYFVQPDGMQPGATYVPITPCRIVDTRRAAGAVAAFTSRTWRVAGDGPEFADQGGRAGGCGVPDNAVAVELTLSATEPRWSGYLRAWPADVDAPVATMLNYPRNHAATNTGAVAIATNPSAQDLTVEAFNGTTHVVVDVQGYYTTAPGTGASFTAVNPCRIVDTRLAGGSLAAGTSRVFRVTGTDDMAPQGGIASGCGVPVTATAVEATISVVDPAGTGYLRAWPADGPAPTATVANFHRRVNVSNTGAATIAIDSGTADIAVRSYGSRTHVVIDIEGWYAPSTYPTSVSAGGGHSCALMNDATVRCWGSDLDGELGDGRHIDRAYAAPVSDLTDVAQVSVGADHTCARRIDGTAACWGANSSGQLGDGTTDSSSTPLDVPSLSGVTSIASGLLFTCASLDDGTVRCWGTNDKGQLGVDPVTTPQANSPVQVSGLSDAVSVAVGHQHACAILQDGTVRCWGDDSEGELGDGPTDSTAAGPVAVTDLGAVTSISAGYRHTCATTDGTVRCWGGNANGRLGDGTTIPSNVPVLAVGIGDAASVTVGGGHTCARLGNGDLRCWGYNAYGQIGDGTTDATALPTTVGGGTSGAVALDAGSDHTCAALANGTVRCWGYNSTGQVGDGTTEDRTSPVAVLGL
ncbi:MAG: hypothetical protein KDB02_09300 [Acidimicrobiales bacterium]|nr:hypothetical protein [Acidimicrobiales bacterium]